MYESNNFKKPVSSINDETREKLKDLPWEGFLLDFVHFRNILAKMLILSGNKTLNSLAKALSPQ